MCGISSPSVDALERVVWLEMGMGLSALNTALPSSNSKPDDIVRQDSSPLYDTAILPKPFQSQIQIVSGTVKTWREHV